MHDVDESSVEILTDTAELLWRNVHPSWIETDGKLSSQAFRPTAKDQGRLSTARSGKVSAADHFAEYTAERGLASAGVWAVTVGEAGALGLPCAYDEHSSALPQPAPKGHTSIDFSGSSGSAARRAGATLRDYAEARGRQHPVIGG
jgi:hypothetical protein